MEKQDEQKLQNVLNLQKAGMSLQTACQVLGYKEKDIERLQNEKNIDLPPEFAKLFNGFKH